MSGPAGREGAKIRINKGPWDAFLSLSELPKRDNLPIRKKRKEKKRESGIMSRATRDFYFILTSPWEGRIVKRVALHFSRVKIFFSLSFWKEKAGLDFFLLNFWKSGLSSGESLNTREWKDFYVQNSMMKFEILVSWRME